jgi:hypothetical protein
LPAVDFPFPINVTDEGGCRSVLAAEYRGR